MKQYNVVICGVVFALLYLVTSIPAIGQDIVVGQGSTFHGSGTYHVKGNIDNSTDTGAVVAFPGRIELTGTTSTQTLGSRGTLQFDNLVTNGSTQKLLGTTALVDSNITLSGTGTLVINNHKLTINGSAVKAGGILDAAAATDTVVYNGAVPQSIIDATYTQLHLANTGIKDLSGPVVATTLTQTGGALNVNKNLTINGAGTIAAVDVTDSLNIKGNTTIDSLGSNTGRVSVEAATAAFTKPVTSAGTLAGSNGGVLQFQSDLHNNGTLTLNDSGKTDFAGVVNGSGAYALDSLSTATYSAATDSQVVAPAAYGSLVLKNNHKKAADALTVKSGLAMDQNLVVPAGKALTMTSSVNKNVTGNGEVVGTVTRTGNFTKDSLYAFNGAHIALALDANVNAGSATLTMLPDSNLDSSSHFTHYVKRQYNFASSGLGAAKLAAISLAYSDAELVSGTNELKLGVREFNNIAWSKLTSLSGAAGRHPDATNNFVMLDSLSGSLAGVTGFGLVNVAFRTVQTGDWANATTWDEGVPSAGDDAEIDTNHVITVTSDTTVGSLTLLAGGTLASLNITGGNLTVQTSFDNNGNLTVGSNRTLNVGLDLTNYKNLVVSPLAMVKTTGKLKNYGDVQNDGTIDIGQ